MIVLSPLRPHDARRGASSYLADLERSEEGAIDSDAQWYGSVMGGMAFDLVKLGRRCRGSRRERKELENER